MLTTIAPARRAMAALIVIAITAFLLVGCNSGGGGNQGFSASDTSVSTSNTATTPTSQTATITIQQTLAKAVPANVVSERFTGFSASGAQVFGPSTQAKATVIVLTVPVTMTRLQIDYLDANGVVVFVYTQAVALTAGGTLTITDPDFTTPPGPPAKLAFLVQPSNVSPATAIAPPVQVAIQDAQGQLVTTSTASVTIALGSGNGTLSGTTTVSASAGVATFTNLKLDLPGSYTLAASASGLTPATSSTFTVGAGGVVATALKFTVQPVNVLTGSAITPAVEVSVIDANGNTVTTATNTVTVAIGTNPGAATLGGTLSKAAVNGKATFSDLTLDKAGNGYTLAASANGLTGATSSAFNDVRVLSFAAPVLYATATGASGQQVTTGDWNGDGKDDFATVDNNQILVFISKGDGTFNNAVAYATDAGPIAIISVDVTGDNVKDLVVACANTVDFFSCKGDGTFNAKVAVATGNANSTLRGICAGRFMKTARTDIAVVDFSDDSIYVYANNNNTLAFTVQNFPSGGALSGDRSMSTGDFNNDGAPDIAIACFTGKQVYWMNSGSGVLATLFPAANAHQLTLTNPNGACQTILAGDFNGDGFAEIFAPDDVPVNGQNQGNIYPNAAGTFGTPVVKRVGQDPFGSVMADFNLDGRMDIGVSTFLGLTGNVGDLEVLLGNGDGTFQNVQAFNAPDNNVRCMAAGDFNGDGLMDAVVSGGNSYVYLNTSK